MLKTLLVLVKLLLFNSFTVNVGEDCPVFDGLYEFCQLSAGGSVAAAVKLNKQVCTVTFKIIVVHLDRNIAAVSCC